LILTIWRYASWFAEKCQVLWFSFNNLNSSQVNHLKFMHNVLATMHSSSSFLTVMSFMFPELCWCLLYLEAGASVSYTFLLFYPHLLVMKLLIGWLRFKFRFYYYWLGCVGYFFLSLILIRKVQPCAGRKWLNNMERKVHLFV
jgi:hypothetical protein